jgi:Predicted Zn-dependent protease (DUF2268)
MTTVWRVALILLAVLSVSCRDEEVWVEYYPDNTYEFSPLERLAIQRIAKDTVREVKPLLPQLPKRLVLRVGTGSNVMPETGANGTTYQPNIVDWTVDPTRREGALAIIEKQLRPILFHELHHLVRKAALPPRSLMDRAIMEGLATAFERDYAKVSVPWGEYPPEVEAWFGEFQALPPTASVEDWLFRHPDGRRWIGFKVGTYLVDRASRASGRSSAELVTSSTEEILRLAQSK